MNYLFRQSQGKSTVVVILQNPLIKEGTVYATRIGIFVGWNDEGEEVYEACEPLNFIAGGGPWSMVEYQKELE